MLKAIPSSSLKLNGSVLFSPRMLDSGITGREQQLVYCNKCVHRKFDLEVGTICGLTKRIADFRDECPEFSLDIEVVKELNDRAEFTTKEVLSKFTFSQQQELYRQQNYPKAVITGLIVGLLCAIGWAFICIVSQSQWYFFLAATGAAVGYSMRFAGKGIDRKFGLTGMLIALLTCVASEYLGLVGILMVSYDVTVLGAISLIDFELISTFIIENWYFMKTVFYISAIIMGYKFAFRVFTQKDLYRVE